MPFTFSKWEDLFSRVETFQVLRPGFFEKKILSILSTFLSPEKLTQKNLSLFAKIQFLNDKTYTKNHLELDNLAKLVFWSILPFKNWAFANLLSFFCVSFSGERKFERIVRKIKPHFGPKRSPLIYLGALEYKLLISYWKQIPHLLWSTEYLISELVRLFTYFGKASYLVLLFYTFWSEVT